MLTQNTVEGWIRPDGTLELSSKLTLSPGKVRVTVEALDRRPGGGRGLLELMAEFAEVAKMSPIPPRTKEQIDADLKDFSDDFEASFLEIEAIQQASRESRKNAGEE